MSLREILSDYWYAFQQELFPRLESELGPMGERYELFVAVLELVRVEALLPYFRGQVGRPEEDRAALARAFIAKAVFDVPTTRALIERLEVDGRLRRLCGWSGGGRLPSEATFSRAFSEFAESGLASRLHETLIARTMDGHLVEHISRDATAIEAREKPQPKRKGAKPKRRKRGRPRKGEERAKEASRLERQLTMTLPQMLADLPRACDVGTKRNAKGHTTSWIGYKLHVDTADGGLNNLQDVDEDIVTTSDLFSISSFGVDYPVETLVSRMNSELFYIPDFQRQFIWSQNQSSRFIESLLLGLPVPGIFLFKESETGRHLVIDGQQRLKSLQYFSTGIFKGREFRLTGLESDWEGQTHKTLSDADRARLADAVIHATVFKQDLPQNDINSVYEVFERINTGGSKLSPQEIRSCICHGNFNTFLHRLNQNEDWRTLNSQNVGMVSPSPPQGRPWAMADRRVR